IQQLCSGNSAQGSQVGAAFFHRKHLTSLRQQASRGGWRVSWLPLSRLSVIMLKTSTAPSTVSLPDISFFADVFRHSAVPTMIMGPDSKVLFWNGAMER